MSDAPQPAVAPKKWYQFSLIEWIVGVGIIVLLIALLIPSVKYAISSASLDACKHNLKFVALGFHQYHDAYGTFPPAYTTDEDGLPMHSWRVLILPYIGETALYNEFRLDEPWNSAHNLLLQDRIPELYICPKVARLDQERQTESKFTRRLTNYVVIEDATGIFDGPTTTSLPKITDDDATTILAAEVRQHAVHWMQPDEITPDDLITELEFARDESQRIHYTGAIQIIRADGSVCMLFSATPVETVQAMITKAGGEPVNDL